MVPSTAREGYRLGHALPVDDMYRDGFLCRCATW
jgi:hypothetical protein